MLLATEELWSVAAADDDADICWLKPLIATTWAMVAGWGEGGLAGSMLRIRPRMWGEGGSKKHNNKDTTLALVYQLLHVWSSQQNNYSEQSKKETEMNTGEDLKVRTDCNIKKTVKWHIGWILIKMLISKLWTFTLDMIFLWHALLLFHDKLYLLLMSVKIIESKSFSTETILVACKITTIQTEVAFKIAWRIFMLYGGAKLACWEVWETP